MQAKIHNLSRNWLAFSMLCIGQLMIILDTTIVNVALKPIEHSLQFSPAALAWVLNAYLLTFGGFLLLSGRLGDLLGRKKMFLSGIAVFTVASLLCGLANSQIMLIAARALQGLGGAMIAAISLAMIYSLFTREADQRKAMTIYSFVSAAGGSFGLLAGGLLTQYVNWHWIFLVNIPFGILVLIAGMYLLDSHKNQTDNNGVDVVGALLITLSSMGLVYTIIQASEHGWTSPQTFGFGVASLLLIALFIFFEKHIKNPLVPLQIFKQRNLVGSSVILSIAVAGIFGWFFLSTLYFQQVVGFDSLQTGLAFLPLSTIIALFSLKITERAMKYFGPKKLLLTGLGITTVGLLVFAFNLSLTPNYLLNLLPGMVLFGSGMGLVFVPLMTMGMSDSSPQNTGLAAGILSTAQQIGAALGLAILASIAASQSMQLVQQGQALKEALISGYHLSFMISIGFIIAAIILSLLLLRAKGKDSVVTQEEKSAAITAESETI